ncbi:MAG: hypothetical protein JWP97_4573 [Labilithrix sp.]|nr:hypothetical protein [Labilithrix sp.]
MTRLSLLPVLLLAASALDCRGAPEARRRALAEVAEAVDRPGPVTETIASSPAPLPARPPDAPAIHYASLSGTSCLAELRERGVPHESLAAVPGVAIPVRLTGPLSGVTFRTLLPAKERARSKYEIVDCRLALALDDFGKQLAAAHVVEAMHYSAYRPPPAGWSSGPYGLRHEGALAMDVAAFRLDNGLALNVKRDFAARPGEMPCAPGPVARTATQQSLALRSIVCAAHEARLFHLALTPDYDQLHSDHFHLEVTPGATAFTAR